MPCPPHSELPPPAEIAWGSMAESDLEEVVRIERATFPNPWTHAQFRDGIAGHSPTFGLVARREDRIAGYAVARAVAGEGEILNVAVSPDERRRGLGRALVVRVLEEARARGASEVHLEVRSGNRAAIALYRSLGFRTRGRRRGYYAGTGDDAWVMTIRLGREAAGRGREEAG